MKIFRTASALACVALLTGCIQMPTSGPVVESQVSTEVDDAPGISFDPRPPRPGESASEIVGGFLEAMKATPIRTTVARQFLSQAAQEAWAPEEQIITYAELGDPEGSSSSVRLQMTDVNLYDARGTWDRTLAARELGLGLVQESGEWRIDQLPDALIVPDSWFEDWYQRVSLYFFDPTSEVLVPEPVFAPRGEQLASALVRGLLTPPDEDSSRVSRTYFPPGTTHGLSVPISTAGIAEVSLTGDPDAVDEETAQRMLAQLVWTLRQEPRIRAVELSVGGRTFGSTGGSTQVNLDVGSAYAPNGVRSTGELFALSNGLLVRGTLGAFEETLGPLGQVDLGLRHIGVDIAGSRVAAVSDDGTEVRLAQVEALDSQVETVVDGAVDLQAPVWDHRDRMWVLDRNGDRARVLLVVDGRAREVTVPGVTRRPVQEILVSRDGSRLIAVVRGRQVDRVLASRIQYDDTGRVLSLTPPQELSLPLEGAARIRDVGWRSPTTVSVLSDITDDFSQVRTFSVDGSPAEIATSRLRGRTRTLVSVPLEGSAVYALAGRSVTDLTRPERTVPDLPRGLTDLTFAG